MEQKINYQRKLDALIKTLDYTPKLLLHSCCAPCSSYCLEYLAEYFSITVLYYNPNISPEEEFFKRAEEQRRLIAALPVKNPVSLVVDDYDPHEFFDIAKGLENVPEGGERCFKCYRLRLERAANYAAAHGFDYFCTTLSISPLKNAAKINEIGEALEAELSARATSGNLPSVKFLPSDFKKKGGYLRSIELSREYELYRQNYCGCVFSKPKEA
ncbi:MAG: epoxyqueuosine reductase QueH [Oscillospiraceae bacterium]